MAKWPMHISLKILDYFRIFNLIFALGSEVWPIFPRAKLFPQPAEGGVTVRANPYSIQALFLGPISI
jgi:hypothetical protein